MSFVPEGGSAADVLADCAATADLGGERLAPLADGLRRAAARLGQPMRVAVAGQIKRGKSTLVNALLGEPVAATGQLELTLNVNELRYGEQPSVTVHHRDGTPPEQVSVERFHALTVHDPGPGRAARLARIRKVEYALPVPLLRTFRLVDTPGLGSVLDTDSGNAAEFLGISGTADPVSGTTGPAQQSALTAALDSSRRTALDVHRDSAAEVERADAVLYLFSRALHERDLRAVGEFTGPIAGSMTPLKAFGVLSRCDQYWPPGPDLPGDPDPMTYDPMAAAAGIVRRCMEQPEIARLFFTVVPVAGLLGSGAGHLSSEQVGWLDELARTAAPEALVGQLGDAGHFAGADSLTGTRLPPEHRRTLIEGIGAWGVHRACQYLRGDLDLAGEDVRARLLADSGIPGLRDLVTGHFGNRASLIKLDHGLREVAAETGRRRLAAQQAGEPPSEILGTVADRLQVLRQGVHGFAELAALSDHYTGRLDLTGAEVAQLLQVTGEYGTSCAARVGLPARATPGEIEQAARAHAAAWASRALDPVLDRRSAPVARTLRHSYERIEERAHQARFLLEATDETALEAW